MANESDVPEVSAGNRSSSDGADPIQAASRHWTEHGWAGGDRMMAALSIARVAALTRLSVTKVLQDSDLTFTRHELLAVLYFSTHGEMSLGRISSQLFIHPTSVTTTVDALERLGFVERIPNPQDRRGVRARITALGRERVEKSTPAIVAAQSGLEAMTDEEARVVVKALAGVRKAAGDFSD